MGDGESRKSGLRLCTDSYELIQVVALMNVLICRYDIVCRIHWKNRTRNGVTISSPRIFIPESELIKLRNIVMPHMISLMYYKVGIRL
jgi:hypothetical protein